MPIWKEEVFGPVLAVRAVASFETRWLQLTIRRMVCRRLCSQPACVKRSALSTRQMRSGVDQPTNFGLGRAPAFRRLQGFWLPFKEQGLEGLRFYTRIKTAAIRFDW